MYESELINIVEEGKEYKREILEEFVLKHHYHLYSKTMGSNLYLGGQVMCVVIISFSMMMGKWYILSLLKVLSLQN